MTAATSRTPASGQNSGNSLHIVGNVTGGLSGNFS